MLPQTVPEFPVDSSYSVTSEGYQLHCDSKGVPPMKVVWYENDILIYIDDYNQNAISSGLIRAPDGSTVYRHSQTVSTPGVYFCGFRTNWMMADRSSSGRISE